MKVAVLSESPADESVARILVEGLLARETSSIPKPAIRTRGWPSVLTGLPGIIKYLHYRTDAEAVVVLVDSNHSPVHAEPEKRDELCHERCRLCLLRQAIVQVRKHLRPVANRTPLKTAVGVAVPCIEAWYQCGRDPTVSEAAWSEGLRAGSDPYTPRSLKQAVYGTDRQSLQMGKQRGIEEANRLVKDLAGLEQRFSVGFGALGRDIRAWLHA